MNQRNKVALITGGSSGIGLSTAKCFAKAGYNLLLNGLEKDGPELARVLAAEYGVKVAHSPANLLFPAEIEGMVAQAEREFGRLDVLVNNAGIQHVAPIDEFAPERWDAVLAVNLSAVFHASRAAWKGMKERKFGRISEEEVVRNVMLAKHSIKEFVEADATGTLALYLASDEAALLTGVSLPLDGGWTAQ